MMLEKGKIIIFILLYVVIINVIGFLAMGLDKYKAKKGHWRIKEQTLLFISLIGGSIGTILGMYVFHHKTKKWYFKYGFPTILVCQVVCIITLIIKLKSSIF